MFANVNGIKLYYEKTGSGKPIVLLHGNTQSHKIFSVVTRSLRKEFTVYALDSRDHGKSSKVKQLNYSDMTKDTAEFIKQIIGEKTIVYGLSDGGIIALMLAAEYPELVSQIIVSGASTCPSGSKDYAIKLFKFAKLFYPSKMKMLLTQPNITAEMLQSITIPTAVLAGSRDMIKEENTKFIAGNIPGSTLEILNGETHTSYAVKSDKLYPLLKKYIIQIAAENKD